MCCVFLSVCTYLRSMTRFYESMDDSSMQCDDSLLRELSKYGDL